MEDYMKTTRLLTLATAALLGASLTLSSIASAAEGTAAGTTTGTTQQVAMTRHHQGTTSCRMHCRSMRRHHMKRHRMQRHQQRTAQR